MTRTQFGMVLTAAIIFSFIGGFLSQVLLENGTANAESTAKYIPEVRTKAMHLVGADGKVRASFYLANDDSPHLVLYDQKGNSRLNFGLGPVGQPGLTLKHPNAKVLVDLDTKGKYPRLTVGNMEITPLF